MARAACGCAARPARAAGPVRARGRHGPAWRHASRIWMASRTSHCERSHDGAYLRSVREEAALVALHEEQVELGRRAVGQHRLVEDLRYAADDVPEQLGDAADSVVR